MGNSKTLKTSHDQARGRDQLILDYNHNLHYGTYLEASSALAVLAQDGHLADNNCAEAIVESASSLIEKANFLQLQSAFQHNFYAFAKMDKSISTKVFGGVLDRLAEKPVMNAVDYPQRAFFLQTMIRSADAEFGHIQSRATDEWKAMMQMTKEQCDEEAYIAALLNAAKGTPKCDLNYMAAHMWHDYVVKDVAAEDKDHAQALISRDYDTFNGVVAGSLQNRNFGALCRCLLLYRRLI
ncbi:MAG: hypothetical protein QF692_04995 [Alphaproteobacteria bacterium]|nr:hypothetical protein [Alphaproteobacteria bacterium]MDP7222603.1 hypothetical protein [Alphaproteobacteria bacterium]